MLNKVASSRLMAIMLIVTLLLAAAMATENRGEAAPYKF
jgi:hypothetical protein